MKRTLAALSLAIVVALLNTGCQLPSPRDSDDNTASGTTTSSTPTTATTTSSTPSPSTSTASTTAAPKSWVMPDLVGQHLQAAQDAVQELTRNGIFFTTSVDATGRERRQILDTNWQVCSQNVRPGERITETTEIEFSVVKLAEQCP